MRIRRDPPKTFFFLFLWNVGLVQSDTEAGFVNDMTQNLYMVVHGKMVLLLVR